MASWPSRINRREALHEVRAFLASGHKHRKRGWMVDEDRAKLAQNAVAECVKRTMLELSG